MTKRHLRKAGLGDRTYEFEVSDVTVEPVVQTVECEPAHIAEMLSFMVGQEAILIMAVGGAKVDGHKYREQFHTKVKMLSLDKMTEMVGYSAGGVCPFGMKEGVSVCLNESLKRSNMVYPTCDSASNAVKLTVLELEIASEYLGWIDACKGWRRGR